MYLSSYEYDEFSEPRKIISATRLQLSGRTIFRVVVDSPVFGQNYGLGGIEVNTLYLVGRFEDKKELNSFPFEVHVFIHKLNKTDIIDSLEKLQNIGWASVYDNERDAIDHKI